MTMENKPANKPADKSAAHNGLTYAQAGVDIDAGNLMVEKIKPLVRSTRRPGADGEIGGFCGLFDLKAAGFKDPVLVAANDGVGTKLKIAIDADKHDTVGIDLVAMCVNSLFRVPSHFSSSIILRPASFRRTRAWTSLRALPKDAVRPVLR